MLQQREHRPSYFIKDLLLPFLGSDNMKGDIHVGLEREQVGHAEEPGIHRSGVFHLERALDSATFEPDDIDPLDSLQSYVIVVQRQDVEQCTAAW